MRFNQKRHDTLEVMGLTEDDLKPDGWARAPIDGWEMIEIAEQRLMGLFGDPSPNGFQQMLVTLLAKKEYTVLHQALMQREEDGYHMKEAVLLAEFLARKYANLTKN